MEVVRLYLRVLAVIACFYAGAGAGFVVLSGRPWADVFENLLFLEVMLPAVLTWQHVRAMRRLHAPSLAVRQHRLVPLAGTDRATVLAGVRAGLAALPGRAVDREGEPPGVDVVPPRGWPPSTLVHVLVVPDGDGWAADLSGRPRGFWLGMPDNGRTYRDVGVVARHLRASDRGRRESLARLASDPDAPRWGERNR
jgi:hypothetical protein